MSTMLSQALRVLFTALVACCFAGWLASTTARIWARFVDDPTRVRRFGLWCSALCIGSAVAAAVVGLVDLVAT